MFYPTNVETEDGFQLEKEDQFRARLRDIARLTEELVVGNYNGRLVYFNGEKQCRQKKLLVATS